MAAKNPRLPSPFAREIDRVYLAKKILARIYLPAEKEFAESLYQVDPDRPDVLVWQEPADKAARARVKKLAAVIRKNRGFVHWGPLLIAGSLIAAILVFSYVFKDRLLEEAFESGLQEAFQAQAQIDGLRFDPLGGLVHMDAVAVADKDQPMQNLFSFGKTQVSIDTWQLVQGKVVFNNLECLEVRFGGPRSASGALPGRRPAPPPAPGPSPFEDPALASWVRMDAFDPARILEREMQKLQSFKEAERIRKELEQGAKVWEQELATAETRYLELQKQVKVVQGINPAKLNDLAEVRKAITTVQNLSPSVQSALDSARTLNDRLASDWRKAQGLAGSAAASVQKDWDYLVTIVENPGNYGKGLVDSTIRRAMGPRAWEVYGLLGKLPGILEALKTKDKEPDPDSLRKGRTVAFPTRNYPRFLIKHMALGVHFDDTRQFRLDVKTISSDPERAGGPTMLQASYQEDPVKILLEGAIDIRAAAQERFAISGDFQGIPLDAGDSLKDLALASFQADLEGGLWFRLMADGSGELGMKIALAKIRHTIKGEDLIARVVTQVMQRASSASVQGLALFPAVSPASLTITSDVDEMVGAALEASLRAEVKKAQADLEREFRSRISQELAKNAEVLALWQEYQKESKGRLDDTQALGKVLDGKKAELEARLKNWAGETLKLPGLKFP